MIYYKELEPDTHPSVSSKMENILKERYDFEEDGEIVLYTGLSTTAYFEGLEDAGIDGARDILNFIEKHKRVILWRVK